MSTSRRTFVNEFAVKSRKSRNFRKSRKFFDWYHDEYLFLKRMRI